jgi:rRNA maturation endonuclease Nob1
MPKRWPEFAGALTFQRRCEGCSAMFLPTHREHRICRACFMAAIHRMLDRALLKHSNEA